MQHTVDMSVDEYILSIMYCTIKESLTRNTKKSNPSGFKHADPISVH